MPFLPSWAPSVHPLIIHFPIALLIFAILFDVVSWRRPQSAWLKSTTLSLYVLGGLSAIGAFISGRLAADVAAVPPQAHGTLSEHADLGLFTAIFFTLYALLRWVLRRHRFTAHRMGGLLMLIVAAAGIGLLFETAEHGAKLVYRHGVGVEAVETARQELEEKTAEMQALSLGGVKEHADGSWSWNIQEGAEIVWKHQFSFLAGDPDSARPATRKGDDGNNALELDLKNQTMLFVAGNALQGTQIDARLQVEQFRGEVRLVHNVQDEQNYDFVSLNGSTVRLGRVAGGKIVVDDEDEAPAVNGWLNLRAVGEGRHRRGYVNDKLVTHGHAAPLPAGRAGLFIEGTGKLLLQVINVQATR